MNLATGPLLLLTVGRTLGFDPVHLHYPALAAAGVETVVCAGAGTGRSRLFRAMFGIGTATEITRGWVFYKGERQEP